MKINVLQVNILIFCFFITELHAHETPAEIANLSLYELSRIKLNNYGNETQDTRWSISYRYRRVVFKGYRNGNSDIPLSDVLFDGNETRTSENFPVVPTKITQEAHIFNLGYRFNALSAINVVVPYLLQSTHHVSIVPGFASFSQATEGIGDVVLSYDRDLFQWENSLILAKVGISFPSGSISQSSTSTPRPGNQQLPFTMQLGSGTFDFPIEVNYYGQHNKWTWGAGANAKFRSGRNSRNYRLGHTAGASLWSGLQISSWLKPILKIDYRYSERIHGLDKALLMPNSAFPFPIPIANPRFFGGHKIFTSFGIELSPQSGPLTNHAIGFSYAIPIYQNLNGIQIKQSSIINVNWNMQF